MENERSGAGILSIAKNTKKALLLTLVGQKEEQYLKNAKYQQMNISIGDPLLNH